MPMYTYYCSKCNKEMDFLLSITDEIPECIECGGELDRVYNFNGSFDLKGEGFYKTEYKG